MSLCQDMSCYFSFVDTSANTLSLLKKERERERVNVHRKIYFIGYRRLCTFPQWVAETVSNEKSMQIFAYHAENIYCCWNIYHLILYKFMIHSVSGINYKFDRKHCVNIEFLLQCIFLCSVALVVCDRMFCLGNTEKQNCFCFCWNFTSLVFIVCSRQS